MRVFPDSLILRLRKHHKRRVKIVDSSAVQRELGTQELSTHPITGSTNIVGEAIPQSTILSPGKEVTRLSSSKKRTRSHGLTSIPKKKHASARQFGTRTSTPVEQTSTPSVDSEESYASKELVKLSLSNAGGSHFAEG